MWDSLLTYQEYATSRGDLLEISVFHGKAAGMLALHARNDEFCTFVDILPTYEAQTKISQVAPHAKCNYVQEHSGHLLHNALFRKLKGVFRWVHIDGGHSSADVITDLNIAHRVLQNDGIVVLDDFFSPAYPQITAALFGYLARHPSHFSLVLVGLNKGYLCRPKAKLGYLSYIKNSLHQDMLLRNHGDVVIWKTNTPNDQNCFGITPKGTHSLNHRGLDTNHSDLPID